MIVEQAQTAVALVAEKAPDGAGLCVVVDVETGVPSPATMVGSTDGALAALFLEKQIVPADRQALAVKQASVEIGEILNSVSLAFSLGYSFGVVATIAECFQATASLALVSPALRVALVLWKKIKHFGLAAVVATSGLHRALRWPTEYYSPFASETP